MLTARTRTARQTGFSLVELAITLAVVAVLATAVLVPVVTQIREANVRTTNRILADARDALLGYAALNGRLPCPAVSGATGTEAWDPVGTVGSPADGRCASFWGFVPGRTLGLTPLDADGYLLDAWGTTANRVRYAVSSYVIPTTAVPPNPQVQNPFTTTDGMRRATLAQLGTSTYALLTVCDSGTGVTPDANCNTARTLTDRAVAVIWSVGANAPTGGTGVDEAQNNISTSADRIFVSRVPNDDVNNPFDDVVTWLGLHVLVNRMIVAGQLP